MKKLRAVLILGLIMCLMVVSVSSAFAAPPAPKSIPHGKGVGIKGDSKGKPATMRGAKRGAWFGEVTSVDTDKCQFTLLTRKDIAITVKVAVGTTRLHRSVASESTNEPAEPWKPADCNSVGIGDWASVKGRWENDMLTAEKIHIMPEDAKAGLTRSNYSHTVGVIKAVEGSLPGGKITVERKKLDNIVFTTSNETELRPDGTTWSDVTVGAKVNIFADRDRIAKAIVLRGPKDD